MVVIPLVARRHETDRIEIFERIAIIRWVGPARLSAREPHLQPVPDVTAGLNQGGACPKFYLRQRVKPSGAGKVPIRFGSIAASPLKPNADGCPLLVQQRTFIAAIGLAAKCQSLLGTYVRLTTLFI